MNQAVSIWQIFQLFSHYFFNLNKFLCLSLMVEKWTKNFLIPVRMVTMTC
jgi:hypothetical protein